MRKHEDTVRKHEDTIAGTSTIVNQLVNYRVYNETIVNVTVTMLVTKIDAAMGRIAAPMGVTATWLY